MSHNIENINSTTPAGMVNNLSVLPFLNYTTAWETSGSFQFPCQSGVLTSISLSNGSLWQNNSAFVINFTIDTLYSAFEALKLML